MSILSITGPPMLKMVPGTDEVLTRATRCLLWWCGLKNQAAFLHSSLAMGLRGSYLTSGCLGFLLCKISPRQYFMGCHED